MGEVKTGALIVIEKTITLEEYEKTGIPIDGVLTSRTPWQNMNVPALQWMVL